MESLTELRVRYTETDARGIVHHGAPSAIASAAGAGGQRGALSDMGVVRVVDNPNMESLTELRVRYAETDAMGIVHHATYPVWMELGRSDFLRELGQSYAEWEARGVRLVVNEIRVRFRAPARYDELVQVRTSLQETGRRRVTFGYRIERDGVLLAEGESVHLVAGSDNRARVLPDDLLALIQRP